MELYGQKDKSIPQKIFIHLLEILLISLSYWILFSAGGELMEDHLHIPNRGNGSMRRAIIFIFNLVIFLRFAYTMFFLVKRKMPWEETFTIPFAFGLYYVGFSLFALPLQKTLDALDYFSIALFLIGCTLNTLGEIWRDNWKKDPSNKGKLYTEGLFKYSRHINYFGDLLWVSAYALITRNWYAISIPVFLFCFFAFYNAPKLDSYLKHKYSDSFDEYSRKTAMLIPFIF